MNEKRIGADRIRVEIKSRDILSILSIIYDRHNAISRDLDREVPEEFQLSCSSLQVLSGEFDKLGYLRKILSEALHTRCQDDVEEPLSTQTIDQLLFDE